ncbi:MAG TPA: O-antigen ligase family protein [bacterium]|nr:O-antigen ligase family protein [bacterium]
MAIFVCGVFILNVLCFGGVSYMTVALSHLLAVSGLIWYIAASVRKGEISSTVSSLFIPLAVVLVLGFVQFATSERYFYARREYLIISGLVFVFFLVVQHGRDVARIRSLLGIMTAVVGAVSLFAVAQHIVTPDTALGVLKPFEYRGRLSGTLLSPNHFGNLVAVAIPVLVSLLATAGETAVTKRRFGPLLRAAMLLGIAAMAAALIMTRSRGSMIAALAGLGVLAVGMLVQRPVKRSALIAVLALIVVIPAGMMAGRCGRAGGAKAYEGDRARVAVWQDTVEMIRRRPLAGYGLGSYRWEFPAFKREGISRVVDYAHNDYLQIAAETGAVGLFLFLAVAGMVVAQGLQTGYTSKPGGTLAFGLTAAMIAGLGHACIDFNLRIPANALLLTVCAGSIAALHAAGAGGRLLRVPVKNDVAKAAAWIVAFVLLIVMIQDGTLALAAYRYNAAEKVEARLGWDDAARIYRGAFGLDHRNPVIAGKVADLAYKRYLLSKSDRDLLRDEAVAWYDIAVSRNPADVELLVKRADMYHTAGMREKAEADLKAALAIDPFNGFVHRARGMFQLRDKDYAKAAETFTYVLKLYPRDEKAKTLLEQARKGSKY